MIRYGKVAFIGLLLSAGVASAAFAQDSGGSAMSNNAMSSGSAMAPKDKDKMAKKTDATSSGSAMSSGGMASKDKMKKTDAMSSGSTSNGSMTH